MKRPPRSLLVMAAAVIACTGFAVVAQPESAPPARRTSPSEPPKPDRESVRARLQESIARTKRIQERLEQSLARLDEGAPPEEVLRDMENTRPQRGDDRDRSGFARDGDKRRDGPREARALSPEERERLLTFMKEHTPVLYQRFAEAIERNPERAGPALDRLGPRLFELAGLRNRDPRLFELRVQELVSSQEVPERAEEYHRLSATSDATPERVEAARQRLRDAIGTQTDARMRTQLYELEGLEKRVARVKADLENWRSQREKIIDDRVDHILDEYRERAQRDGEPTRKPD